MNLLDVLLGPAPANATYTSITVETMLLHGLNKRLSSNCSSLACIIALTNANKAAGLSPASFVEATAIPEDDAWRYGGNASYVCSAFAAMLYKQALGALLPSFQATEQTPIDNVHMSIYDSAWWSSANCPTGLWQPTGGNGSVCQILGEVRMPLDGFNTIPLYASMNNFCGSQWPKYERCPGGAASCSC